MRIKLFQKDNEHPDNIARLESDVNAFLAQVGKDTRVELQWTQSSAGVSSVDYPDRLYASTTVTAIVTVYD